MTEKHLLLENIPQKIMKFQGFFFKAKLSVIFSFIKHPLIAKNRKSFQQALNLSVDHLFISLLINYIYNYRKQ